MKRTFVIRPGDEGPLTNCHQALSTLDRTKTWDIDISPHTDRWTHKQRNALHALLRDLSREYQLAYGDVVPMDDWKTFFKRRTLGDKAVELPNGKIIDVERSLSDAGKHATMELITFILDYSAVELGITLTPPDEYKAWQVEKRG